MKKSWDGASVQISPRAAGQASEDDGAGSAQKGIQPRTEDGDGREWRRRRKSDLVVAHPSPRPRRPVPRAC